MANALLLIPSRLNLTNEKSSHSSSLFFDISEKLAGYFLVVVFIPNRTGEEEEEFLFTTYRLVSYQIH